MMGRLKRVMPFQAGDVRSPRSVGSRSHKVEHVRSVAWQYPQAADLSRGRS
jgi:hypothetical protein